MNRLRQACAAATCILAAVLGPIAKADNSSLTGGQTIRIENSDSECVVPNKSTVSITVTSVRVPSSYPWPTWLKNTKALGAKVDLSLDGPTGTTKRASFPVGKLVSQLVSDNSQIIRATLDIPVLTKYKLYDSDGDFAHIDMPLTLVKVEDNSGMKNLIASLNTVTTKIKLPPSPFETGLQAFAELATDLFALDKDDKTEYPNAILGYELVDAASQCTSNQQALRTGAQVQIFTAPYAADNVIDIADYLTYCYYSTSGLDPNILFSAKPANGSCPQSPPAGAKILNNPQVIFVVNAYPIQPQHAATLEQVKPTTAAAVSSLVSRGSDEFARFAALTQGTTKLADRPVSVEHLRSLNRKLGASVHSGKRTVQLTAQEKGAAVLTRALQNCALVGLPAQSCN